VIPETLAAGLPLPYRTLLNKYWVDEIYGAVFVRGLALGGGNALHAADRYVVDGGDGEVRPGLGVNGVTWGTRDVVARASDLWDRWVVDGAVNLTAFLLDNLSYAFRSVQNGLVQHYALSMLIGIFLLIAAGRFVLGLY
jgi:NADH-quinone oxidoreductase subunit L